MLHLKITQLRLWQKTPDVRHAHHSQNIVSTIPSMWVPCKQYSWTTWEEAGLPYWVWKSWGQSLCSWSFTLLGNWALENKQSWMFLVEGRKRGSWSCMNLCVCVCGKQNKHVVKGWIIKLESNKCSHHSNDGENQLLSEYSNSLQTSEAGVRACDRGWLSLPTSVPWNIWILPQGWDGPT